MVLQLVSVTLEISSVMIPAWEGRSAAEDIFPTPPIYRLHLIRFTHHLSPKFDREGPISKWCTLARLAACLFVCCCFFVVGVGKVNACRPSSSCKPSVRLEKDWFKADLLAFLLVAAIHNHNAATQTHTHCQAHTFPRHHKRTHIAATTNEQHNILPQHHKRKHTHTNVAATTHTHTHCSSYTT